MRDHRIDLDLSLHVPIDDFRHVGAAAGAAESAAAPHPAGDELKRPGRNLLAGAGDADDDDALAPAAMGAFERLAHEINIADALEGVIGAADLVGAALGHVDEMGDEVAADLLRIDEVRHAEALTPPLH